MHSAAAILLTLALSVPLLGAAPAASAQSAQTPSQVPYTSGLALPLPTGPYTVGRHALHLVDRHRTDPWVPTAGNRKLMASVSYPARGTSGSPAAYTTADEAQLLLEARGLGGVVPAATVAEARTHAQERVRPAPG